MKQNPKEAAWIPMADYMQRGVRKPKTRIHPLAHKHYQAALPETWVDLEDHLLRGVTKKHTPPEEFYIQRLKPPPPIAEIPPEAYLTLFDALQEIWAVPKPKGAIFSRLTAIQNQDRAEWATGHMDDEEYQRRQTALDAIRLQYAAQTEEITEWFLQNRLRLFDTLPNA